MKYRATQTCNMRVNGRVLELKDGELYELTEEDMKKIPPGYFLRQDEVKVDEETWKESTRYKKKKGD